MEGLVAVGAVQVSNVESFQLGLQDRSHDMAWHGMAGHSTHSTAQHSTVLLGRSRCKARRATGTAHCRAWFDTHAHSPYHCDMGMPEHTYLDFLLDY